MKHPRPVPFGDDFLHVFPLRIGGQVVRFGIGSDDLLYMPDGGSSYKPMADESLIQFQCGICLPAETIHEIIARKIMLN